MQVSIIKPGILTTIQDMGRYLYMAQGVPVSGAMDVLSARIANKAVGNTDNAAVIEFTYAGAEFRAQTDVLIACCGEGAILKAGAEILQPGRPLFIPKGTTIILFNNPAGSRTYLAVAGGWEVPEMLGSRSTYTTAGIGGVLGRALVTGDVLNSMPQLSQVSTNILALLKGYAINYPKWGLSKKFVLPLNKNIIRVVPANEFTWFNGQSLINFLSTPYILSLRSNRMGYHLAGVVISRKINTELLSTAVTPGTIQVSGNGSLILLMADCQTTGGYPRIAQVASVDMPLCGQLKPGDAIHFIEISRDNAERLYLEQEKQLHKMTIALTNKFL